MTQVAGIETASSRKLTLRARSDLASAPISFRGARYWSIKDPLSLRYYQLCDEEHFILQQLDGTASLEQIQAAFEGRFAPRKLQRSHLHAFLAMLHREGLVVANAADQGEQLLARHRQSEQRQRLQQLSNILAIRFRGVDPDAFLRWAYPSVRWLFSVPIVFLSVLMMFAAVALVVTNLETVIARLPAAHSLLAMQNILLLAIVLAICKVLHELGHAFACKHFGGECHELGFMLLVFTPCLYCNVSDAWMIPNKWRRIAISAAGIYVELLLATACTFLWWFSQPGLVNSVCLSVMLVCSVSTLLFNGNPLLRYDGYFILADLVERPNLRQQAQAILHRFASRCLTGNDPDSSWIVPSEDRVLLGLYGVASVAYRCFIIGAILFFVHRAVEPYRLEILAQLLAGAVIVGIIAPLIWQAARSSRDSHQRSRLGVLRPGIVLLLAGACVAGICLLPVSRSVLAPVVLEPANATHVRAQVAGRLHATVKYGVHVEPNAELAELANPDIDQKVVALTGERDVWKQRVAHIQRLQVRDRHTGTAGAGTQLLTATEALAATERRLAQAVREQQDFQISTPNAGVVLPPRDRPQQPSDETLEQWSGRPFDARNEGCFVDADTTLGLIGDPQQLQGNVLVSQANVERIRVGQRVSILVDELPTQKLTGAVEEIARLDADQLPRELTQKRMLAGEAEPIRVGFDEVYYSVRVNIERPTCVPPLWSSGRARIQVEPRSLGRAVYEQLCQTFRIDL